MTRTLRIAVGQMSGVAGDLTGNTKNALDSARVAVELGAQVLVLPEMAVAGYPVDDMLGSSAFLDDVEQATRAVTVALPPGLATVLGTALRPEALPTAGGARTDETDRLDSFVRTVRNTAVVCSENRVVFARAKHALPEYSTFQDARWFARGPQGVETFVVDGTRIAVIVCEDLWVPEIADAAAAAGTEVLLVPNASPYSVGKPSLRELLVIQTAQRTGMTVVYVNFAGGQDEAVYDGGSLVCGPNGQVLLRAPLFATGTWAVDVPVPTRVTEPFHDEISVTSRPHAALRAAALPPVTCVWPTGSGELYGALVAGMRDYVAGSGLAGVLLGLSGGLDSGLVAALAVDALGPDRVWGIGMPGPYSSAGSVDDARDSAANLGCRFDVIPIKGNYEAEVTALDGLLDEGAPNGQVLGRPATGVPIALENIQARNRMMHLMTLANAHGLLVLGTSNRSESAVGYFTLYGDAAAGFAPIKDVPKTVAYELARWRNEQAEAQGLPVPIPWSTITKPPSAELAPDQLDANSLPPYPVLDTVLAAHLEQSLPPHVIADLLTVAGPGWEAMTREDADALVLQVLRMVDRAEHKRRQCPPGIRISQFGAFGRDRRVPITNGYLHRCVR